jgi:hypothetical protein
LRDFYKSQIIKARHTYGITPSSKELLDLLKYIETVSEHQVVWVPIWALRRWFKNSDSIILPHSQTFYHGSFAIDPSGALYSGKVRPFETRFLEVTLFEDMCVLFNLTKEYHHNRRDDESKKVFKQRLALQRATIVAAFNVVEAYLNGIAFDYVEIHGEQVTGEAKMLLTEWDFVRQRPRYMSLRDKLLSYPRLILGLEHPPLQESNCEELKFVVETAKRYRDAIVHSSPAPNVISMDIEKERAVYSIDFETVERIVDATVTLISKLEEKVNGGKQRLEAWLHPRSSNGMFPDVVFA